MPEPNGRERSAGFALGRGLYAVTPDLADTADLVRRVQAAIAGGVRLVQYRNKLADVALRGEQARALGDLCARSGAALIINDDPALALTVGAAGAHLGRDDPAIGAARELLGEGAIVGVSCYDRIERAIEAQAAGASYVAFGAAFPSPTKPQAVRASLELFREARARVRIPIAAIGGITADNAGSLVEAGVDLLAVITDLFEAPDIRARALEYRRLFSLENST